MNELSQIISQQFPGFVPDGKGGFHKPKNNNSPSVPEPERDVEHAPDAAREVETQNPKRCLVRVTGFRLQLLDPDGFAGSCKYALDALRYANIIREDTPEAIKLEVEQVRVKRRCLERTEIEITLVEPIINHQT